VSNLLPVAGKQGGDVNGGPRDGEKSKYPVGQDRVGKSVILGGARKVDEGCNPRLSYAGKGKGDPETHQEGKGTEKKVQCPNLSEEELMILNSLETLIHSRQGTP